MFQIQGRNYARTYIIIKIKSCFMPIQKITFDWQYFSYKSWKFELSKVKNKNFMTKWSGMHVFGLPNLNGSYIFIVLFSNSCSWKCNDLIFTSSYDIYLYRLRPALFSGGIRITNFLTVFKITRGRKSTPISYMRNSAPADASYLSL